MLIDFQVNGEFLLEFNKTTKLNKVEQYTSLATCVYQQSK